MDHTVPTVGYVLDEVSRPGALHASRIHPILHAHGIPLHQLRHFKNGSPIELPTGESRPLLTPNPPSPSLPLSLPPSPFPFSSPSPPPSPSFPFFAAQLRNFENGSLSCSRVRGRPHPIPYPPNWLHTRPYPLRRWRPRNSRPKARFRQNPVKVHRRSKKVFRESTRLTNFKARVQTTGRGGLPRNPSPPPNPHPCTNCSSEMALRSSCSRVRARPHPRIPSPPQPILAGPSSIWDEKNSGGWGASLPDSFRRRFLPLIPPSPQPPEVATSKDSQDSSRALPHCVDPDFVNHHRPLPQPLCFPSPPLPGEVLRPEDFMDPSTSRRVAILSDSRDSSRALAHCVDADIIMF
jgi:hypothetical protein